ncbi:hypothetical protein J2755_000491 [Methanohalophilus levihalophilus]|uniref:hypothetical protein n=1 Tax=Methanohalophilus levihalophilus TaxID=1431282 RepID=UPI001AE55725|nr:hypothetical protein [Methanohalophilus levihalophilus]MBP2029571.1 hypothetical protein [Methanohalophilus levihalophilus]
MRLIELSSVNVVKMVVGNPKEKGIFPDIKSLSFLSSFSKSAFVQNNLTSGKDNEENIICAVNSFYTLVNKFLEHNGEIDAFLPDLASGIIAVFPESHSIVAKIEYEDSEYLSGDTTNLLLFFDYSVFFQSGEKLYVQLFSKKPDLPTSFNVNLLESFLNHLEDLNPPKRNQMDYHLHIQDAMKIGNFCWWELKLPEWEICCDESLERLLGIKDEIRFSTNPMPYELYINQIHPDDREFLTTAIENCIKKE